MKSKTKIVELPLPTDEIRNDSSLTISEAMARVEGGIELRYGDIMIKVERHAFEQAQRHVNNIPLSEHNRLKISIDNALRRALPKMRKGHFSKKTADNFCNDLLLWEALKSSTN